VDEQLAAQDARVAAAADAWLTDPLDTGIYGRLVLAVRDRRAYLDGTLDATLDDGTPDDPDDPAPPPPAPALVQPDDGLDDLDGRNAVQPLAATLAGADPREILDRLRGARPPGR
jgi:hypothetical protein